MKVSFVAAVTMLTMQLIGADHSLGTWKLIVDKAEYSTPGYGLKSETIVREPIEGGVRHTVIKVRKDNTTATSGYTCHYDGSECPGTGTAWAFNSIIQRDSDTFTYVGSSVPQKNMKKGASSYMTGTMVISNDEKTMTLMEMNTTGKGQTASSTRVYERQ